MNGLNCESKISKKKAAIICIVVSVISIILTLLVVIAVVMNVPGVANLILLDNYVNQFHLGDYNKTELSDGVIDGYINSLSDKYAGYYNISDTQDRSEHLLGIGSGIGVSVIKHPDNQFIYIIDVYENSPAEAAGLRKGDVIVEVDSNSISEIGYVEALNSLKRENGEIAQLKVLRDNNYLDFEVEISDITVQSVFYEIIDSYGYIKITSFNSETVAQFKNAVNQLTAEHVKGFIFDLRSNGGGTVDSAGQILDVLVPEGNVMTVKYKDGSSEVMLTSDAEHLDLPMTVLIDENTASAAELFSATIRDFNKGVLIGSKTYGKGVMQNTYQLLEGATAVFTVAEFLPHSNVSFNEVGLIPDIEVILDDTQYKYRFMLSYNEDPCISAALKWLNGDE